MSVRNHDTGPSGVTVDQLVERLFPVIDNLLTQIDGDEFTTNDFIDIMKSVPEVNTLYEASVRAWGEQDRPSRMVIHGQVIPGALRKSSHVEWVGFAHDEPDDLAVPAWWRLTTT